MHILITGANGYIGLRLLVELSNTPHHVTAVVRNTARIPNDIRHLYEEGETSRLELLEADFLDSPSDLPACPDDVDAAYYLIHSMGVGEGFERRESDCAKHFTDWISDSSARQIIYLSGLLPKTEQLSKHLASRERVYQILTAGKIPVTTLRASIIVGSGSASFEIIRDLVEKLPVMITPRWAMTKCQPIAVRNVLNYLTGVIDKPETIGQSYDIGGPDTMTYFEMLRGYARARGLTRFVITVPVFSPRLSSYWLS
ncbi:MAG: NAD(P)H-binding protein, partial [Verrucomicrobiae bacterium]|nr:NAD(P)H-binding protein [Verrucomicrobiae bacterium]NNJ85754.1 NAD(P)H-binding protein [Akkermansiaceae bacterium]